jgi:hypothetical protein
VSAAVTRLLADTSLRARLGRAGVETANEYAWTLRIDQLERFLADVAQASDSRQPKEVARGAGAR